MQDNVDPERRSEAANDFGACLRESLGLTRTPEFILGYAHHKFEDEADIVKLARTLTFSAAGGLAGTIASDAANAKYKYTADVSLVCVDGDQVHGIEFGRLPVLESGDGFKAPQQSVLIDILSRGAHRHHADRIEHVDGSFDEGTGNAAILFRSGSIFLVPFSTADRDDLVRLANRIGEREFQHSLTPPQFVDAVFSQAPNPPEDLSTMAQDPEYQQALETRIVLLETDWQIQKLIAVRDYCPEAYSVLYRAIEGDSYEYPMVVLCFLLLPISLGFLLLSGWEILGGEFEFVVIAVFLVALLVAWVSWSMVSAALAMRKRNREFRHLRPPE